MEALLKQGMLVIKTQRTQSSLTHQEFDVYFAVSGFNAFSQNLNITQLNKVALGYKGVVVALFGKNKYVNKM